MRAADAPACAICAPGTFADAALQACKPCAPGNYAHWHGMTRCLWWVQSQQRAGSPLLVRVCWPRGATHQHSARRSPPPANAPPLPARRCAPGTYADEAGAARCKPCADGTVSTYQAAACRAKRRAA